MAFVACTAQADTGWNEAVDGILSPDRLAPTAATMRAGSNLVLGTAGDSGNGIKRNYFKFDVAPGNTLHAVVMQPGTTVSGSASFLGMMAGPQMTVTETGGGAGAQSLLALWLCSPDQIGFDILGFAAAGLPGLVIVAARRFQRHTA